MYKRIKRKRRKEVKGRYKEKGRIKKKKDKNKI